VLLYQGYSYVVFRHRLSAPPAASATPSHPADAPASRQP
jgi:hypothetical protein